MLKLIIKKHDNLIVSYFTLDRMISGQIYFNFDSVKYRIPDSNDYDNDNNPHSKTILETFKNILSQNGIANHNNHNNHNYFFIHNGKLLNPYQPINTIPLKGRVHIIECFQVIRGGDALDDILGAILSFFDPIVKPINAIGQVFIFIMQILVWLAKFIYWFIFFIIWIFSDLLNPVKLVADFWNSILLIMMSLISVLIQIPSALAAVVINGIGGWMQGFFGWDQSNLTKRDKQSRYFRNIDRSKGKKCYLTNNNTVPFSILLGTIICPPIGVFMDMGATGWMNIFICGLLTLFFYIPGLLYALLVIYS